MINYDLMSQDHKIGSAYVKEENCQKSIFSHIANKTLLVDLKKFLPNFN
jgi:hypothetical protein